MSNLGYVQLVPSRDLIAGEGKEFVIIYTTGDHLIEENGVIRVSSPRAWTDFQFDNPQGPRYTTVSNNTKVDIELKKGYYSQLAVPNIFM